MCLPMPWCLSSNRSGLLIQRDGSSELTFVASASGRWYDGGAQGGPGTAGRADSIPSKLGGDHEESGCD